jgi:uncharacterized membrane protein YidH (DUF202 family)
MTKMKAGNSKKIFVDSYLPWIIAALSLICIGVFVYMNFDKLVIAERNNIRPIQDDTGKGIFIAFIGVLLILYKIYSWIERVVEVYEKKEKSKIYMSIINNKEYYDSLTNEEKHMIKERINMNLI